MHLMRLLGAVVLVVVLAACGSESDDGITTEATDPSTGISRDDRQALIELCEAARQARGRDRCPDHVDGIVEPLVPGGCGLDAIEAEVRASLIVDSMEKGDALHEAMDTYPCIREAMRP